MISSVTADGIKTIKALLDELFITLDISKEYLLVYKEATTEIIYHQTLVTASMGKFILSQYTANAYRVEEIILRSDSLVNKVVIDTTGLSYIDGSTDVLTNGTVIALYELGTI